MQPNNLPPVKKFINFILVSVSYLPLIFCKNVFVLKIFIAFTFLALLTQRDRDKKEKEDVRKGDTEESLSELKQA